MPLDTPNTASITRTDGRLPPDLPPPTEQGAVPPLPPVNNQLVNSVALRWLLIVVSLFGGGSIAGYTISDGSETTAINKRIDALEVDVERIDDLESRVKSTDEKLADALAEHSKAMKTIQDMSLLSLELAVEGHRYTTDTLVEAIRLDHPNFTPPKRPERLERRLERGARILDDAMYSR